MKKFKFTVSRIKNLDTPNTVAEYGDTEISTLQVFVTTKGQKCFKLRKKFQRTKTRVNLGDFEHMTVDQVRNY
ncbi:hypothetical protein GCM10007895_03070 [Paraferrimonas sedimenticola]|uniref:Integrase n=1 Tax=Paraferrimonas sedimenticola TaxID=375674 RepID=A0AA37RTH2_9GAMM|nr:hypothetical protein GCM10007895_03070 [Paraferrimonas sedimenticola]